MFYVLVFGKNNVMGATMSKQIQVRVDESVEQELREKGLNPQAIAREAWENALRKDITAGEAFEMEEAAFQAWAEQWVLTRSLLINMLDKHEKLTIAEYNKAKALLERIEQRMKSINDICDGIPDFASLTYEDLWDWQKLKSLVEANWENGLRIRRIGVEQIKEYILYREVQRGNFASIQAAWSKFSADRKTWREKITKDLEDWWGSEDFLMQRRKYHEELQLKKEAEIKERMKAGG